MKFACDTLLKVP